MIKRGGVYNAWTQLTTSDESYSEAAANGCQLEIRARESADIIELLVCVYAGNGDPVFERVEKLPGREWTVADALIRGRDRAERIAGGESGRLPCADSGPSAIDR